MAGERKNFSLEQARNGFGIITAGAPTVTAPSGWAIGGLLVQTPGAVDAMTLVDDGRPGTNTLVGLAQIEGWIPVLASEITGDGTLEAICVFEKLDS